MRACELLVLPPMPVYICYVHEPDFPETVRAPSHFVLAGIAIPAVQWMELDGKVLRIKRRFELEETERYIHLTEAERNYFLAEICDEIATWNDARLFAEAYEKNALTGCPASLQRMKDDIFFQVLSRFQAFLVNRGNYLGMPLHGLVVTGRNGDAVGNIASVPRNPPRKGTPWSKFDKIVESPLLVDIRSASMMQIADVCRYAIQRFFENGDSDLFDRIYAKFDRAKDTVVGIRHYTAQRRCQCRVCVDHSVPLQKKWSRGPDCLPA